MQNNLREKEILILNKMLTLGSSSNNIDFNDQWKVLIYDHDCRDIISPLLNIGLLRGKGVTLHMLIHTNREPVPDAPAVYFIRPNEANIKRIVEDCSKQLYRTIYLNFLTRIDRNLLELLVNELVAINAVSMISKVYDQYLDTIALEPTLFTLNIKDSFMMYNETSLTENQIRSFMTRVATGLLSTIRVLGSLPIIRCAPGGASEMLAKELNSMLKENISSRGPAQSLFEDCLVNDRSRPLLIITDRMVDLFPIFQHASTYQGLISDLLDFKLNRVNIEISNTNSDKISDNKNNDTLLSKKKTYDLNTTLDSFLRMYASSPFPEAIDANERELAEVTEHETQLRSRPDISNTSTITTKNNSIGEFHTHGKDLSEAIESLPELLSKKNNLEAHTNILQAAMKKIASREIPTYFELEQGILTNGGKVTDKSIVISLLKDSNKGVMEDKLRLLLILAIIGDTNMLHKSAVEELDQAFRQGCEGLSSNNNNIPSNIEIDEALCAMQYIRKLQSLQSNSSMNRLRGTGITSNIQSNTVLSSLLTTAHSKASSLISKATSFFIKFTPYYITRVVDNLSEGKLCFEDETFCYFDPRLRDTVTGTTNTSNTNINSNTSQGHKYSDVIVFVLGGGNYTEYFNLNELLKDKISNGNSSLRSITYGCTDMISGNDFINQLYKLSRPNITTK